MKIRSAPPRYSTLKARYTPSHLDTRNDYFLGYVAELDIWFDPHNKLVVVVGPPHRKKKETSMHNFDTFDIVASGRLDPHDQLDLDIELHEMCLIYALCAKLDIFKDGTEEKADE